MARKSRPSVGSAFHSLHATSQALQPMQIELSVKKPTRSAIYARLLIRPGRMSQVAAFTSWMWTLGSSTSGKRSLAESPRERPREPQW